MRELSYNRKTVQCSRRLAPHRVHHATRCSILTAGVSTCATGVAGRRGDGVRNFRGRCADPGNAAMAPSQHARRPPPGGRVRQGVARPVRVAGDRGRPRQTYSGHGTTLVDVGRWPRLDVPAARRPALEQRRATGRAADRRQLPAHVRADDRGTVRRVVRYPGQRAGGAGRQASTERAGRGGARRGHAGIHAQPQRLVAGIGDLADCIPGGSTGGAPTRHATPPTDQLVGNGAYRLQAWTPRANLVVERNTHLHDAGNVAIPSVRFHVTEDATAELQRFAAGNLDLTEVVAAAAAGCATRTLRRPVAHCAIDRRVLARHEPDTAATEGSAGIARGAVARGGS